MANFQNQSYYQLVRQYGRAKVTNPNATLPEQQPDGRTMMKPTGGILIRPIDKQENYIKRCVAVAGDSIRVVHCQLYVNGQPQGLASTGQFMYEFVLKQPFNEDRLKERFDISGSDIQQGTTQDGTLMAWIPTSQSVAVQLEKFDVVVSMTRQDHEIGFYDGDRYGVRPIFPNNDNFHWSEDNFGPIWIPKKYPMDLIEAGVGSFGAWVGRVLPAGALQSLLVDGVIAGVGSVIVFLPQILILFFFIVVLEDSGYLPRAAYLLDRLMGGVGLSGRAFIPLLSSFACAIPGIMAARTIPSVRERIATIMIAPLMTCSARLPV